MSRRTKIVTLAIGLVVGLSMLFCGLLLSTQAPSDRCFVCGEPIQSRHSMLYYLVYGHERAWHLACMSPDFRKHMEDRLRELAKERANQIDDSGRSESDPLSQSGPRRIVQTVERDIAAFEKQHPKTIVKPVPLVATPN
jgi:hypothetical protein